MENFENINSITIVVKANMPKTRIVSVENEIYKVEVHAQPENNKANIEIIKFFSKLTKKQVKIITGLTSKKKVLKFL